MIEKHYIKNSGPDLLWHRCLRVNSAVNSSSLSSESFQIIQTVHDTLLALATGWNSWGFTLHTKCTSSAHFKWLSHSPTTDSWSIVVFLIESIRCGIVPGRLFRLRTCSSDHILVDAATYRFGFIVHLCERISDSLSTATKSAFAFFFACVVAWSV